MADLGYDSVGGTTALYSGGLYLYAKFTATASFTATTLHVWVDDGAGTTGISGGIYADSSGSIGAKIRDTNQGTAINGGGWVELTFDSSVSITNGTTYWLAWGHFGGGSLTYRYGAGSYDSKYSIDTYVSGATPATPSSPANLASDRRHSIYAAGAGGDVTAPVLSSPVGTATGETTATIGATTDEGNGTLYGVVTTSSTQPSAAQIKAGQTHTGAAAPFGGSTSVGSTGAKTINATGLTASTAYYAHLMHEDTATNQSNRVTSAQFTTDAPPANACVCLGDSITEMDGLGADEPYPEQLALALGADWSVYNEGVSSDTLEGMEARVDTDVVPHLTGRTEKAVIVLGGINNSIGDTAAQAKVKLDSLFDELRATCPSGTYLLCGTLTPTNNAANTFRNDLNALILADPPDCDGLVHFAFDQRYGGDDAADDTGLYPDGTHPSAVTCELMAATAAAAIAEQLYPVGEGGGSAVFPVIGSAVIRGL
jgi:lysophospholipase L1-like esterase